MNEITFRRRVNVSQSVKGILSFDVTVESENAPMEQVLYESDKLVAELKTRYPVTPEKEK